MFNSTFIGYGAYLPDQIVTNHDLENRIDTTHEWIVTRTGIEQRHIVADGEYTSDLATKAAQEAIANAGITKDDVDLIIVATCTPDETIPSTAVKVQNNLGISNAAAFDVNAACSGFIYAVSIADNFIKSGQVRNVLVIGAETMSRIVDWNDRNTCVLFGDGAGAVVVSATQEEKGIFYSKIESSANDYDFLKTDGGISTTQTAGCIKMVGKEVFKSAVEKMSESILEGLEKTGLSFDDIDLLIPHQANFRIINAMGKKLGLQKEKIIITLNKQANTSAATIPLALYHAYENGMLEGDRVLALSALGAGFTWGAMLLKI